MKRCSEGWKSRRILEYLGLIERRHYVNALNLITRSLTLFHYSFTPCYHLINPFHLLVQQKSIQNSCGLHFLKRFCELKINRIYYVDTEQRYKLRKKSIEYSLGLNFVKRFLKFEINKLIKQINWGFILHSSVRSSQSKRRYKVI